MSERILRALMQLFAIVAKIDEVIEDEDSSNVRIHSLRGREIIASYLKSELSTSDVESYLAQFDTFLNDTRSKAFNKSKDRKRASLQSVKTLRICEQINAELTQRQKFIVLMRVIEFTLTDSEQTEKEKDFLHTLAQAFRINDEDFYGLKDFIKSSQGNYSDSANCIFYSSDDSLAFNHSHQDILSRLDGVIQVYYIESVKTLFFKYYGDEELFINGQLVSNSKIHIFNNGSTVRTLKSDQLFYSDVISRLNEAKHVTSIYFEANNISHSFKNETMDLKPLSFSTNEGNLIGIMGGSGTGKSTLINILNGKIKPTDGFVSINGIDLHKLPKDLQGVIGNVPQSDTLIEELTVFENLFYSAKLSLGELTDQQIARKVINLLSQLGLYDIKESKVGGILERIISGGQRKRLNIALELIREPSILFVDEPTSGLSSRDSENIMDLLKEIALSGKLVFTVIHQPSSNIFKLFDRLFILDEGGYMVYDGIPLNALVHFKKYAYRGNAEERECTQCGNVNPEQIFGIIDARIIDEFGNETNRRKKDALDWYELYLLHADKFIGEKEEEKPEAESEIPSRFSQFSTYLNRDLLSKLRNLQYITLNLLIAPSLAFILAFFIKYFSIKDGTPTYTYFDNQNIPQFIFIAVIAVIFLGLTISAEEINKDKKLLLREQFMNLSRQSYLLAKLTSVFLISAIQTLLFTLITLWILEIKDMFFHYWIMLFTASASSSIIGLNISSAFNSTKVIYIIVPLLIIPQLLFSGAIVEFGKLHPSISNATKVPLIGNVMISRWAYEGLIVNQQTQNKLESEFLIPKAKLHDAEWHNDFWIPAINNHVQVVEKGSKDKDFERSKSILINEIKAMSDRWDGLECNDCLVDLIEEKPLSPESKFEINNFLKLIRLQNISTISKYGDSIQTKISNIGLNKYKELRTQYTNPSLEDLLTKRTEINKILEVNGRIYQNDVPVYKLPKYNEGLFDATFYSPYKNFMGSRYKTYWINLIVIWVFSFIAYVLLYFDILKLALYGSVRLFNRVKQKRTLN